MIGRIIARRSAGLEIRPFGPAIVGGSRGETPNNTPVIRFYEPLAPSCGVHRPWRYRRDFPDHVACTATARGRRAASGHVAPPPGYLHFGRGVVRHLRGWLQPCGQACAVLWRGLS